EGNTSEFSKCTTVASAIFSISGRLLNNAQTGITNATVTLSGDQSKRKTTDRLGKYKFTNLRRDGNFTVTPSKVNIGFTPTNRTYMGLQADQTNQNFTGGANNFTISGNIQSNILGGSALGGV